MRQVCRIVFSALGVLASCAPAALSAQAALAPGTEFEPVYRLLHRHCSECHIAGGADFPWSLNTPPGAERFPECLQEPAPATRLRCATYHQLTDAPGPGIPAWIRPSEPTASDHYVQACDAAQSFHIGSSLPGPLPPDECVRLLDWIRAGARY